jgi:hypothetical protein
MAVAFKMRDTRVKPARKRYWLTPPDLMAKLQAEFAFDFDACPHPRPDGFDGLKVPWGKSTWVNPPFTGSTWPKWIRKGELELKQGNLSVFAIPVYCARPIQQLVKAGAEFRPPKHIAWIAIEDGEPNPQPDWVPVCLAVLRPGA